MQDLSIGSVVSLNTYIQHCGLFVGTNPWESMRLSIASQILEGFSWGRLWGHHSKLQGRIPPVASPTLPKINECPLKKLTISKGKFIFQPAFSRGFSFEGEWYLLIHHYLILELTPWVLIPNLSTSKHGPGGPKERIDCFYQGRNKYHGNLRGPPMPPPQEISP